MHSTTEFATTVLSKCVTHAGFVKVAWPLRGIPFYVGNLILRLDLWIYNFQLSNPSRSGGTAVHFSAFHPSVECWTVARGLTFFLRLKGSVAVRCDNNLFSTLLERVTDLYQQAQHDGISRQVHDFRCGILSLHGLWWGSIVHQFEGLTTSAV